jgi:glycosyltransferase involved in cell wall biosynthesis
MLLVTRNAIFYLTYNGIYNFTNGIGTQTQLLLSGLERLCRDLEAQYGRIDVHVVCPLPDMRTWGYDHAFFLRQQQRVMALGGQVHLIPFTSHPAQELWDIRSWHTLSHQVAPLLLKQAAGYDRSLIICVDQPWLHVPRALAARDSQVWQHVQTLLVLYNTAFIRNWETPDAAEIAWEQEGLAVSQPGNQVYIADVCPSFTAHLRSHFSLPAAQFAPYTSSILANDSAFAGQTHADIEAILHTYHIPLQEDLVLTFGRAAPIKGFEALIPALTAIREEMHFVLISVPYLDDTAQQQLYDRLLLQHRIRATHVKHFTRELPQALCQWPRTKMVAIPSRQETFSNIVLEVALWARDNGPVVVASTAGGFVDQIEAGKTGFFLDLASRQAMSHTLQQVFHLPALQHASIRRQAYQRVLRHYDFRQNFPATLHWMWQPTACKSLGGPLIDNK